MKIEDLCSEDKKDAVSKGFGDFVPLNLNNNKNINLWSKYSHIVYSKPRGY